MSDYLVARWDWIEEALSDEELDTLYGLLEKVSVDKPDCDYCVIDTTKPYADRALEVLKRGLPKVSKEELLRNLKELSELADIEVAHSEADELLLQYINDKDIEEAYEGIQKCYA